MATNSVTLRVAQKELGLFFSSPVAWLFLTTFAAVTLFVFFWVESFFARNIADVRPLFEWMPILMIFLCAAITMRLWSEERLSGTIEHVLTQPTSLWRFVVGKYLACVTLLLLALISTLPLPITISLIANLDWGPVIGGYIATLLMGSGYLAIGLFVSARTDNTIVSMIGAVALCALLYLLGSATFTGFFDDRTGEALRLLGSGARFDSITRGIIDLRDLFYYISLSVVFLTLNVYALEKERWANTPSARKRSWRTGTTLFLANILLANVWLSQMPALRLDLTEGKMFSISRPTLTFLDQLEEPLLIRGYFSRKTHPMLAPLIPQLRDLLKEYELAGKGKVKVELVDPADHPELEQEANERYGITATPFQIADRHQSSLVSAYFNILVRYGSEHRSLGFSDLIEVRTAPNAAAEIMLRNPEYDITHAIKKALFDYRMGGNLFSAIEQHVEFIGYVSADALLPDELLAYKNSLVSQLEVAAQSSQGKFSFRFVEPESLDGAIADKIQKQWGFKPMVTALEPARKFFFYLTLADQQQVVQLPADNFDPQSFRTLLDSGLKRFASDFTKIVALSTPQVDPRLAELKLGGPTFSYLERALASDYSIRPEDLSDGAVNPEADILAIFAPKGLGERSVFAIDQFLMRGGTIVLATSPFSAELNGGQLQLKEYDSGLQKWLAHNGVEIEKTLVLDKQNVTFPAPVTRQSGDYEFRDVQMIDYPYFIDLRSPGLASHPVTGNLPHVTMAWASPINAQSDNGRRNTVLLKSSPQSWRSASRDIMPRLDDKGLSTFRPDSLEEKKEAADATNITSTLGIVVQGRFNSFFSDIPAFRDTSDDTALLSGQGPVYSRMLERSPESARLVVYASNDFGGDQFLNSIIAASGTQYLGPVELLLNTLEWSLQDEELLEIRSRAHFNRTLPPMERKAQLIIEYFNYGVALLWLLIIALVSWLHNLMRRRHYAKWLSR